MQDDRLTILCDTSTGVALAGTKGASYAGGDHADTSVPTVEALFQQCCLPAPSTKVGVFPQDTPHVSTARASLVHIDVDVYESALLGLRPFWLRLSTGGVVVFDDWGLVMTQGVQRAVDELAEELPKCLQVHNLNGHELLIKT